MSPRDMAMSPGDTDTPTKAIGKWQRQRQRQLAKAKAKAKAIGKCEGKRQLAIGKGKGKGKGNWQLAMQTGGSQECCGMAKNDLEKIQAPISFVMICIVAYRL